MKNVTNRSELRNEQLDAVVGGSPSLWDILGPAIVQVTGPFPGSSNPCPSGSLPMNINGIDLGCLKVD